jgi:hypothetical protein
LGSREGYKAHARSLLHGHRRWYLPDQVPRHDNEFCKCTWPVVDAASTLQKACDLIPDAKIGLCGYFMTSFDYNTGEIAPNGPSRAAQWTRNVKWVDGIECYRPNMNK